VRRLFHQARLVAKTDPTMASGIVLGSGTTTGDAPPTTVIVALASAIFVKTVGRGIVAATLSSEPEIRGATC